MVLTMCIINIFVRFFTIDATRMKFLKKKCRFSALSELPFEAHQYSLASLICYRVLLTKTWHWGLPCSPTFIKPTTIAIFIIHPIIGITVNSVNKHPFYGWMLIFAFTYTILFFTQTGIYQWFVCMENLSNVISGVTQLLLRIRRGGKIKRRREESFSFGQFSYYQKRCLLLMIRNLIHV